MTLPRFVLILFSVVVFSGASTAGAGQQPVRAALQPSGSRQAAPAFHLRDASGKTVALSDFSGHAVVLNIWATECGGCQKELPTFVALNRIYSHRNLRVVGVSMDVGYDGLKSIAEAWAKVTPFARTHGLDYTIVVDDDSVAKAYNVTAMPATYLIDKEGRIAATYVGVVDAASITANIQALLAEPR